MPASSPASQWREPSVPSTSAVSGFLLLLPVQTSAVPANTYQVPNRVWTSVHCQFCAEEPRGMHHLFLKQLLLYHTENDWNLLIHVFIHTLCLPSHSIPALCSCTLHLSSLAQPVQNSRTKGRYGRSFLQNTMCFLLDTAYHMTSAGSWCPALTSRGSSWRPALSTLMYPTGMYKLFMILNYAPFSFHMWKECV